MPKPTKQCDAFLVDTYRSTADDAYHPGAITLKKRKTVEVLQWKRSFPSADKANAFVRSQLNKHGLDEVASV